MFEGCKVLSEDEKLCLSSRDMSGWYYEKKKNDGLDEGLS